MAIINEDGYASLISFRCPKCGAQVKDVIFVPKSSSVKRDEHGFFTEGEAEILCGYCTQAYRLIVRNSTGRVFAQIEGFSAVSVACGGSHYRDDLDDLDGIWELPDTPSDNLVDTLADVEEVIKTNDAIFYFKTLSRMALIQQFSALEAYLADTLTKQVLENPNTLSRAIAGIKDLKEIKIPLPEIVSNPDVIKTTVANILRGMLYHNFMKIDVVWNIALGFSLFPNDEIKQRMLRSEAIRHDCVHRNGKDKDGNERTEVNFEFILRMNDDLHALLNHIEDSLHPFFPDEEDT